MITEGSIKSIDRSNMWDMMCSFPMHWSEADMLTANLKLANRDRIKNICVLGMGDSAIAAELLKAFCYDDLKVPMVINKHYSIPAWVDKDTLVIAGSYSGNTEETLQALETATQRGAVPIGITSGGKLSDYCKAYKYDCILIQGEMPSRVALAYTFVPMLRIFEYYKLIPDSSDLMTGMPAFLADQVDIFNNYDQNPALDLAEDLEHTLPIIFSDGLLMNPVNLRWQHQMHVNAKMLCYGSHVPEMTHNEIAGWDQIAHLTGRVSVLYLRDEEDDPRVSLRMDITRDLTENQTALTRNLNSQGANRLERMLSLIIMADWTTFYLALIQGVDPTPITKIDLLKTRLAENS